MFTIIQGNCSCNVIFHIFPTIQQSLKGEKVSPSPSSLSTCSKRAPGCPVNCVSVHDRPGMWLSGAGRFIGQESQGLGGALMGPGIQ